MGQAGFLRLGRTATWGWRSLWCGAVLHSAGCWASLASARWMPEAALPLSYANQKRLQALPNISWEAKPPSVENH